MFKPTYYNFFDQGLNIYGVIIDSYFIKINIYDDNLYTLDSNNLVWSRVEYNDICTIIIFPESAYLLNLKIDKKLYLEEVLIKLVFLLLI